MHETETAASAQDVSLSFKVVMTKTDWMLVVVEQQQMRCYQACWQTM